MFSAPKFKVQKFHDWLMSTVNLELKANAFAMEIISYLAYETVAQVRFMPQSYDGLYATS